ncbi:Methylated-DNA--protein-cysteine methyltransferase [Patulibacter medicamentivorans]|uniref:methylated-DNA--[protein]-cysteine S-methyltransferase n=1 Tax=Patulibacter medicamentivorans TaxID=1097667 RepID=H0E500_9ACTN|nr:methylated-DNA--[protein]-cysteine S-methyltransferase [Patulibacter medicamentivorans]EHN11251.1 Methylated-DNA--protein-cysteine methyltransferase [Patulibacter medicamentivorans]
MTPTPTTDPDDAATIAALRAADDAPEDAFARARQRFAGRAAADGLVDVAYEDHDSPLGRLRIGATARGVVRIGLPAEDPEAVLEQLAREISPRVLRSGSALLTTARHELDEYFAGARRQFDVALDWRLTRAFRRQVLEATARIPYGATSSYRDVATVAGSPNAVRAAGTALATNPLPLLVPCHRVLRSDGALGQYRGGAAAKGQLLALERPA